MYYEIKERTIEESVSNGRIVRNKVKTKVYGLDSSKGTRELLIELLKERVRLHKDKFVSKTLHTELTGLTINKRNGRVDHSELSHDDQIFSYLMGLYVWYEGKNLRENFGIDKVTIKTEDSVDDIVDLDGNSEQVSEVFTEEVSLTDDETKNKVNVENQIKELMANKRIMMETYITNQKMEEDRLFKQMLRNPSIREAYARQYNVPADTIDVGCENGLETIPNEVFSQFNMTDDEISDMYISKLRKNEAKYNQLSDR